MKRYLYCFTFIHGAEQLYICMQNIDLPLFIGTLLCSPVKVLKLTAASMRSSSFLTKRLRLGQWYPALYLMFKRPLCGRRAFICCDMSSMSQTTRRRVSLSWQETVILVLALWCVPFLLISSAL